MALHNILLTHDLKAKVADFGLSIRINPKTSELKGSKQDVIPFRWTAYEVLENGKVFIEKSDVWSFGVLIWEMFHFANALPYEDENIGNVDDLKQFLANGHRLEKPKLCPHSMHSVMLKCWELVPFNRPTFKALTSNVNYSTRKSSRKSSSKYSRKSARSQRDLTRSQRDLTKSQRDLP